MKKWKGKSIIISLCISLILAVEILLLVDAVAVIRGVLLSVTEVAVVFAALFAVILFASRWVKRQLAAAALLIPAVLAVVTASGYWGWKAFAADANYQFPDVGKNQLFQDRKVMVIVPHQDDELNILGGTIEEYVRYGSDVYGVFLTNGDFDGLAETRHREALAVFEDIGVASDHVFFLGYGDNWNADGPHIYNAEPGQILESHIGQTKTYGSSAHSAYREGRDYTVDNLTDDLKSVILQVRPDVIFCSDYDHHIDHKATTLLFDKVIGQILKKDPTYRPVVYKAYAYGTAWEAEKDYYRENILSTQNLFAEPYAQKPGVYRWEDRVRFPVDGATLSRSLMGSEGYRRMALHESQNADFSTISVLNGDKVAWRRYTDSLCQTAEITAASGQASLLNDFMLIENNDLRDSGRMPYDGVWIPGAEDTEKKAAVLLENASDLYSVVLYDHPSEADNILNAVITFDDGSVVETGALDIRGAATEIVVNKNQVSSFEITIMETEGSQPGLTEVEAFARKPEADGCFVKLMDADGNFLYDYLIGPEGTAVLDLYIHGSLPELTEEAYSVETSRRTGTAVLENGAIRVTCPAGAEMILNVTCREAEVSDSILIRNPGKLERAWISFWQNAEEALFLEYYEGTFDGIQEMLLVPRLLEKFSYVIRHLF